MTPKQEPADDDRAPSRPTLSRRRLVGAGAAAAVTALAGCSGTVLQIETDETTVERRFDAKKLSRLSVTDASDDVNVEGWDEDAVRVRAHKRAHGETKLTELELRSSVDGETLHLGTAKPNVVGIGGGSVDLEVDVPKPMQVDEIESGDGDVSIRDVSGDVAVESDDGDVAATGVSGDLSVETDDGDVAIDRTSGVVTAHSDDGDVTISDPGAVRDLSVDDGNVVAVVPAVDGRASIRADDGDVTVKLGDSVDATVRATVDDGEITVAGGLGTVQTTTEDRVDATLGDGTNDLAIHADDGDVTVTDA
jgi:hypothetical protein